MNHFLKTGARIWVVSFGAMCVAYIMSMFMTVPYVFLIASAIIGAVLCFLALGAILIMMGILQWIMEKLAP